MKLRHRLYAPTPALEGYYQVLIFSDLGMWIAPDYTSKPHYFGRDGTVNVVQGRGVWRGLNAAYVVAGREGDR